MSKYTIALLLALFSAAMAFPAVDEGYVRVVRSAYAAPTFNFHHGSDLSYHGGHHHGGGFGHGGFGHGGGFGHNAASYYPQTYYPAIPDDHYYPVHGSGYPQIGGGYYPSYVGRPSFSNSNANAQANSGSYGGYGGSGSFAQAQASANSGSYGRK